MPCGRPPGRGASARGRAAGRGGGGPFATPPLHVGPPAPAALADVTGNGFDSHSGGSRFSVPIFDSSNYHVWAFNMKSFLLAKGSFGAIDYESNNWVALKGAAKDAMCFRAFNWLRISLGNSFMYVCGGFVAGQAHHLWNHVREMYVKTDMATRLRLEQRFQNVYWDTSRHHVDMFLQELYLLRMEHETAGFPLSEEAVFTKLLLCLPPEFDIERSQMKLWEEPDLARARKLLIEKEEVLLQRRESYSSRPLDGGSIFVANGSQGRGSSGVDLGVQHNRFPYKCFYCQKAGHRRRDCRRRLRDERNFSNSNASNSSGRSANFSHGTRFRGPNSRTASSGPTRKRGPAMSAGDSNASSGNVSLVNSEPSVRTTTFEIPVVPHTAEMPVGTGVFPEEGFLFMMRSHSSIPSSWIIDTGATHHICCCSSLLVYPTSCHTRLSTGRKGADIQATMSGLVRLLPCEDRVREVSLSNVLFSPTVASNIISVAPFIEQGCHVIIRGRVLTVVQGDVVIIEGQADEKGLYHLTSHHPAFAGSTTGPSFGDGNYQSCLTIRDMPKSDALRLLHVRLGHLNVEAIRRMVRENMVEGIPRDLDFSGVSLSCPQCIAGKATRLPYKAKSADSEANTNLTKVVADEVVTDSFGPMNPPSRNRNRFVVEFVDVGSRFAFMFPIASLDQICAKYITFRNIVNTQLGLKVKMFHSDGHGSYTSSELLRILEGDGTLQKIRSPYCPEQNAIAERRIRTVVEVAHTLLLHSCIPIICWEDAVCHANYIRNRVATKSIQGKTPFEVFWKRKPNLEWVKPFGCLCYVLIHQDIRQGKFAATSVPGVLLGISDQHSGYKVLMLGDRSVKVARDVRFYEDIFPFRRSPVGELEWMNPVDVPQVGHVETGNFRDPFITNQAGMNRAQIDSNLASLYQPVSISKDMDSSDNKEAQVYECVAEGVDNIGMSLMNDALFEGAILSINEITLEGAMTGGDMSKWKEAFKVEFDAIIRTGTFKAIDAQASQLLHEGKLRVHRTRPVLTIKRDENGNIARYKVQLVVQGYTMQKGVEFDKTFSPCARLNTIRLVISLAAHHNWTIYHSDVPNLYLNGPCSKLILVQLPRMWNELMGDSIGKDGDPVIMANSLYGCPDAGWNWNETFTSVFVEEGYRQCEKEPCLFVKGQYPLVTIIAIWVDDCFVTGADNAEISCLHGVLKSRFNLKVLGPLSFALGIAVKMVKDGLHLSQTAFIEKVAERFGQMEAKPVSLPVQKGFRPLKSQCPQTDEEKADMSKYPTVVPLDHCCTLHSVLALMSLMP